MAADRKGHSVSSVKMISKEVIPMWFVYAMVCFGAWGAADLFYKRGAVEKERYSHLKTTIIVGFVMGASAIITLLTKWIEFNPMNLFIYFPVSTSSPQPKVSDSL